MISRFYYSSKVPARAVTISRIDCAKSGPAGLMDINSTVYEPGPLTVTPYPVGDAVDAIVPGNTVIVSGAAQYLVENPFFELTDQLDANANPMYYRHPLPSGSITSVTVTDLAGNPVTSGWMVGIGEILHDLDGAAYWVHYYDNQVYQTRLLQYLPVWTRGSATGARTYVFNSGGLLTVPSEATVFRIRFTASNGYQVLLPYDVPAGDPWYARIQFNLRPVPYEWGAQLFRPQRPYLLASWVPGRVLAKNLVEFNRPDCWFDAQSGQYPDVLVYAADGSVKFALDGAPPNLMRPLNKGYLFPWRSSQVVDLDALHSRVQVNVDLDPTDRVFGFYSYAERNVVFTALDLNPYSNPAVRNRIVEFYYADRSAAAVPDPMRRIFYRARNTDGSIVAGLTNDPDPAGALTVFGEVAVGESIGVSQFTVTDARTRGGGLGRGYQAIPQASSFWDLGFLDGRPYPIGGSCVVMLPLSVLDRFSREEVLARIAKRLPMGTLPVVRFYDPAGEEYISLARDPLFDSVPGTFDEASGLFDQGGS